MMFSPTPFALALTLLMAPPSIPGGDDAPTSMPDLSRYPCTVPSHVGISLVRLDRAASGAYVLTLSFPREWSDFFAGYVYEVRDSSQNLLATVRGSNAGVQKDTDGLAIRTLTFRTTQPIASEVVVTETYPNAGCRFVNVEVGRAHSGGSTGW
jgi:hypothetical protein